MEESIVNDVIEISRPHNVDMADEWYQHASADHFWMKWRFLAIKDAVASELLNECNLEVGCGHGVVINQFEKNFGIVVDGCDLNISALIKIRNNKGKIYCLDIFDKPKFLLNKYKVVMLLDVLEHINDDVNFLKASGSYLKKGGYVIINVPALSFLFSKYDIVAGHKRRYNKKEVLDLLEASGFEAVHVSYWGFTMIPFLLLRKLILQFVPYKKVIQTGFSTKGFSDTFFLWLMRVERKLISFPKIGTSLVVVARQNEL